MIMPMLREMRSEISERLSAVERRLATVETELIDVRKALVADTLMGRLVSGDFETRLSSLEIDVEALTKGS
jgi:hypothetical protein